MTNSIQQQEQEFQNNELSPHNISLEEAVSVARNAAEQAQKLRDEARDAEAIQWQDREYTTTVTSEPGSVIFEPDGTEHLKVRFHVKPSEPVDPLQAAHPTIGVVVLTHNRDIRRCVERIIRQMLPGDDLVVVEGGSDKEWVDLNRQTSLDYNFKHHALDPSYDKKLVRADGRNLGAKFVNGEYLYFVDGDCLMQDGCMSAIRRGLSKNTFTTGRVLFEQQDGHTFDDHRLPEFGPRGSYKLTDFPWALAEANFAVPAVLFHSMGGFDASWAVNGYCWEGTNLYANLFVSSYGRIKIVLVHDAVVLHKWHEPSEERTAVEENVAVYPPGAWLDSYTAMYMHDPYMLEWLENFKGNLHERR